MMPIRGSRAAPVRADEEGARTEARFIAESSDDLPDPGVPTIRSHQLTCMGLPGDHGQMRPSGEDSTSGPDVHGDAGRSSGSSATA